jgi:hypothetical protein
MNTNIVQHDTVRTLVETGLAQFPVAILDASSVDMEYLQADP